MKPTLESRAHDYRQALPLKAGKLKCVRCGHERVIRSEETKRCIAHREFETSGFLPG